MQVLRHARVGELERPPLSGQVPCRETRLHGPVQLVFDLKGRDMHTQVRLEPVAELDLVFQMHRRLECPHRSNRRKRQVARGLPGGYLAQLGCTGGIPMPRAVHAEANEMPRVRTLKTLSKDEQLSLEKLRVYIRSRK